MVGNFVKTFTKPLFQTNEYITVDGIISTLPFNQSEIDDELMEIRIGSVHPGPKNPPLTNDSSNYEAIECGNYEMTALFAFKGCIIFFLYLRLKKFLGIISAHCCILLRSIGCASLSLEDFPVTEYSFAHCISRPTIISKELNLSDVLTEPRHALIL